MKCAFMDLDLLIKELDCIDRSVEKSQSIRDIPLSSLFPDSFISHHTCHATIRNFLNASGYSISSQSDIDVARLKGFDNYVKENSTFESWDEMIEAALCDWIHRKVAH